MQVLNVSIGLIKANAVQHAYLPALQKLLTTQVIGLVVVDPPTGESSHQWDQRAMPIESVNSALAHILRTDLRANRCHVAVFANQDTLPKVLQMFRQRDIGGTQVLTIIKDIPAPIKKGLRTSTFIDYLVVGVHVRGACFPSEFVSLPRGELI